VTTYVNLDVFEGSASGSSTVTLNRRSRKLVITNDSASNDLQFKFVSSASYATLKPTETISMEFITRTILLNVVSGSAPYRIWSYG